MRNGTTGGPGTGRTGRGDRVRKRSSARRCIRCGDPFCGVCKRSTEGHEYCTPCLHLYVLGESLAPLNALGTAVLLVAAVAMVIFLTELTSNLATAATLLPVMGAIAIQSGVPPIVLTVPITIAASCAFMLPVATPPNAIVFATGKLSIPQMAKAGILLNLLGVIIVSVAALVLAPVLLD